jgi:hypothetical protein
VKLRLIMAARSSRVVDFGGVFFAIYVHHKQRQGFRQGVILWNPSL